MNLLFLNEKFTINNMVSEELLYSIEPYLFPVLYGVAIFIIVIESLTILRKKINPNVQEARVSVMSGISAFGGLYLAGRVYSFALMTWIYQYRYLELGFAWYSWVICFVLYDFVFYINHVLGHKVRFLWCIHQVHHSSQRMRLTSGVRGSMFDFFYIPWFYAWLPLIGIHPVIIVFTEVYSKLWGLLVHVNEHFIGRLGIFEKFMVTPTMHRIHHATNVSYLDTNYGEVLNVWDRIFKTFRPEKQNEKIVYGLTKQVDSGSFSESQFSGFKNLWKDIKSTSSIKNKLLYCIMPPGWNHEGKHETVNVMRANHKILLQ
jgi:sterol desaturase/sphingolipid hydroxylase (fatty acid hydroxylase superfamily)